MNGLLGTFLLNDFDNFFDNYKLNNTLAQEALIVLDNFLPVLNKFFDLCEDLTDAKNLKLDSIVTLTLLLVGLYQSEKCIL